MKLALSIKPLNSIIRLFSSFGLATGLILSIAVMSIIGSLLPPNYAEGMPDGNLQWSIGSIISFFGFNDIFRSPLFLFFGFLLFLNTAVCTGKQLKTHIFRIRHVPKGKRTALSSGVKQIPVMLRLLIHVGIIIIIGGFTLGGYAGFESYIEIPEGKSLRIASVLVDNKRIDEKLVVRCDDFNIEYYDSGILKEFRSDLTFSKDGNVIKRGTLMVNHPITIDGIRYCQAHYKAVPLVVFAGEYKGKKRFFNAVLGETVWLDADTSVYISRIERNFMNMGSAVKIESCSQGKKETHWIFYQIDEILDAIPNFFSMAPQLNPSTCDGYRFSLNGLKPLYATVLMVSYDPGIVLVAFGGVLLLTGLFFNYLAPSSNFRFRMKRAALRNKAHA